VRFSMWRRHQRLNLEQINSKELKKKKKGWVDREIDVNEVSIFNWFGLFNLSFLLVLLDRSSHDFQIVMVVGCWVTSVYI
jgi:hypothetical protein